MTPPATKKQRLDDDAHLLHAERALEAQRNADVATLIASVQSTYGEWCRRRRLVTPARLFLRRNQLLPCRRRCAAAAAAPTTATTPPTTTPTPDHFTLAVTQVGCDHHPPLATTTFRVPSDAPLAPLAPHIASLLRSVGQLTGSVSLRTLSLHLDRCTHLDPAHVIVVGDVTCTTATLPLTIVHKPCYLATLESPVAPPPRRTVRVPRGRTFIHSETKEAYVGGELVSDSEDEGEHHFTWRQSLWKFAGRRDHSKLTWLRELWNVHLSPFRCQLPLIPKAFHQLLQSFVESYWIVMAEANVGSELVVLFCSLVESGLLGTRGEAFEAVKTSLNGYHRHIKS